MNILFLSFTCEDIGVDMVTNMIRITRELPSQARGGFLLEFHSKMASRCEDGTVIGDFLDEPRIHNIMLF